MIKCIETTAAPLPAGHYSQATISNGLVFVSGQLPIRANTKAMELGDIEVQTLCVLENLKAIVEASGSNLAHVLKVTVYLSDMVLWDRVNTVYAAFFGTAKPARAIVPTSELHYGFKIEMDAIAVQINQGII